MSCSRRSARKELRLTGGLLIDKPAGPTSHDVVARVRRAFNTRAVGHAGTLDPFATGLLVVLVGKATRLARFVERQVKRYRAEVTLGTATDTDDSTGAIIARQVPGAWPEATVLTGRDATADAVSALADGVDVLHVAAHGRHSAENAMFAGLQLVDGPWFGYDIDRLRRVPDVVLLSACEVGRSTVRSGEELIGMTTAWLHAGARCVIASPAAINDQAAYDVQAHPEPLVLARGAVVALHERLEEPLAVQRLALVADRDPDLVALAAAGDEGDGAAVAVLQGVVEQVGDDLVQRLPVDAREQPGLDDDRHLVPGQHRDLGGHGVDLGGRPRVG